MPVSQSQEVSLEIRFHDLCPLHSGLRLLATRLQMTTFPPVLGLVSVFTQPKLHIVSLRQKRQLIRESHRWIEDARTTPDYIISVASHCRLRSARREAGFVSI